MSNKTEIWYKVDHYWKFKVTHVDVVKETEKTVVYINKEWVKSGVEERASKRTSDHSFCKTLIEAQDISFSHIDRTINQAKIKIKKAEDDWAIIEAMTHS